MPQAQRLDAALVARGLSVSRTAARKAVEAGRVTLRRAGHPDFLPVSKASIDVAVSDELKVESAPEDQWASRGALKLLGALDICGIDPAGMTALDVGQSTGGFTDVLLQRGARHVVGVDVGHGQLHARLKADARVTCIEGFNARDICRDSLSDALRMAQASAGTLAESGTSGPVSAADADLTTAPGNLHDELPIAGYDLIVMDVSFISLLKISNGLRTLMAANGHGLWLVKPQFEVGPSNIGKGGLVKAEALGPEFERGICDALRSQGLNVKQFMPSSIAGGDGNREYFVWVTPESS